MYNNIGNKIKGLAMFVGWLGLIAGIIVCVVLLQDTTRDYWSGRNVANTGNDWLGWTALVMGFVSVISSWPLYGFGELIDTTAKIELHLRNGGEGFFKKDINWEKIKKEQAEKVTCPVCGTDQKANRTVCLECGAMLKQPVKQYAADGNIPAWKRVEEAKKEMAAANTSDEDKKYCAKCGVALPKEAQFCTGCGTKVE